MACGARRLAFRRVWIPGSASSQLLWPGAWKAAVLRCFVRTEDAELQSCACGLAGANGVIGFLLNFRESTRLVAVEIEPGALRCSPRKSQVNTR